MSADVGIAEDLYIDQFMSSDQITASSTIKNCSQISLNCTDPNENGFSSLEAVISNRNKTLALKHQDFMAVACKLSHACELNKKFGVSVSALMLQMLDIAQGKSVTQISNDVDDNLNSLFPRLIQNFNHSFKQVIKTTDNDYQSVIPQKPAMNYHLATKDRLKPNVEKRKIAIVNSSSKK